MSATLPETKTELLARIEENWSAILRFLETKSEAQLNRAKPGQWSLKDNLAHLSFWERFLLLHHLRQAPAHQVLGIEPGQVGKLNEDQLNQIILERSQSVSLEEVLREMHQTHAELVRELETIDFEALSKPDRLETLIERPLLESVVSNTYEHYQEHLRTMEKETA